MSTPAATLIIDTADLPSLVAVSVQRDAEQFVIWHPHYDGLPSADIRLVLAKRHGAIFGAQRFVTTNVHSAPLPGVSPQTWWVESELLLHGLGIAQRLGCTRVVWPHQVGDDFNDLGPVVDRATLISGLHQCHDGLEVAVIDLPLLDLSDDQIVELADDSGADLSLFWPCDVAEVTEAVPCGDCSGCRRWQGAFERVGPAWPWQLAAIG